VKYRMCESNWHNKVHLENIHSNGVTRVCMLRKFITTAMSTSDYSKLDFVKSKSLQCFDAVGWAAGRASGL